MVLLHIRRSALVVALTVMMAMGLLPSAYALRNVRMSAPEADVLAYAHCAGRHRDLSPYASRFLFGPGLRHFCG